MVRFRVRGLDLRSVDALSWFLKLKTKALEDSLKNPKKRNTYDTMVHFIWYELWVEPGKG